MIPRIITLILLLLTCSMIVTGQSYSVGAGLAYGDDIKEPGINLRAYYNLANNKVCFGPEFTYFKKRTESTLNEDLDISLFELNFNIHYILEVTHKFGIYPLGGLNYSQENEKYSDVAKEEVVKKWGLNLGMGAHYAIHKFVVFLEYDHLLSDLSQNTFIFGTFYTFGKKHEQHE